MGVPGSSTGDVFHAWAQLPIPREQFDKEQKEEQRIHFPECKPLPGAEKLLRQLKVARNNDGKKIQIALATSTNQINYDLKSQSAETRELLANFDDNKRILWDDPRLADARGKPAPDIFLLALRSINETLEEGETPITSEECLVFEDSVPGVEAGRRAGMRVVWVPHQALAAEYKGKEELVFAGRIGLVKIGDEWQLGEVGDGWGVKFLSLEDFPYANFGIRISK
jgi:pseudouridine-5'-monophosphatase